MYYTVVSSFTSIYNLRYRSNITVNLIENESFLKINPMAVRVIKDLQHITEIMQSVIQNNSDPHYVPIKGESRIQSIDNVTVFLPLPSYSTANPVSIMVCIFFITLHSVEFFLYMFILNKLFYCLLNKM